MKIYKNILDLVVQKGLLIESDKERTGTGTISYRKGVHAHFEMDKHYPLVTTKTVNWRQVVAELLWFLRGDTNIKNLQNMGCHIWDPWKKLNSDDLGPVYGYQWRSWNGKVDQLKNALELLKESPFSRRAFVTAWNPEYLDTMALPPCHHSMQFLIEPDGEGNPSRLNLHYIMRSNDLFLGTPYNIASYGLLLILTTVHLKKYYPRLSSGTLSFYLGDAHIYQNHLDQVLTQLKRPERTPPEIKLSEKLSELDLVNMKVKIEKESGVFVEEDLDLEHFGVWLNSKKTYRCFKKELGYKAQESSASPYWRVMFTLSNYNPHKPLKGAVAV